MRRETVITQALDKLPQWAQNRIQKLEADVAYFQAQARQVSGEEDTDTFSEDQRLPKGSRVEFLVNPQDDILGRATAYVEEDYQGKRTLVIRVHDMAITPRSASTIEITQKGA